MLAAAVWLMGGIVLMLKGHSLVTDAFGIRSGSIWPWLAYPMGLFLGTLKGLSIFSNRCKKNLSRIESLNRPKLWQFYSPGFFLALAAMITSGAILSRMAHGHFLSLIAVGALDMALATALFLSSSHYVLRLPVAERE